MKVQVEEQYKEKFLTIESSGNSDANVFEIGFQSCRPGGIFENYIPPHNVLHFIVRGTGTFKVRNEEYTVGAGQGMLSPKNTPVTYHPSEKDPWCYAWFHFSGVKFGEYLNLMNINSRTPIYNISDPTYCMQRIEKLRNKYINGGSRLAMETEALSVCYDLMARLLTDNEQRTTIYSLESSQQMQYVEKAIQYMREHLGEGILVTQISSVIGLNANYLSSLFKDATGLSLQQYLIRLRLQTALAMLTEDKISVAEVAARVGYKSSASFCKAFHQIYGITPESSRHDLLGFAGRRIGL